jgi:DTW domain-containing protein YfiP
MIPQIDNRTNVLILQHVGERFHPFNTARIVKRALRHCDLITDHNRRLGKHELPIQAHAGLLYPNENARLLSELSVDERPEQLVIIDGTWHQAKTIVRDVPQLGQLPCYRLKPTSPGQYRIRREPDTQSLSTLEATVEALRALESDTVGLNQLLSAFHTMVENQLAYPDNQAMRQRLKRATPLRYLPYALMQNAEKLVVAYGEATPGHSSQRASRPVNWVAQRLGTAERFSCHIRQSPPLPNDALEHMRLSPADLDAAVSDDEFRRQWSQFIQRNDILIVYHQRTSHLLRHVEASQPRCLVLKSVFRKWRPGFRSLEELVAAEGIALPISDQMSRADQRLGMAVALVQRLRSRHTLTTTRA